MDADDLWVGTYTGASGQGRGIYHLRRRHDGDGPSVELAAAVDNPSFLAVPPGGNVLYAVSEQPEGEVLAFRVSAEGSLRRLAAAAVPAGPCHLAVHPGAEQLLVASYAAGAVSAQPLDGDGRFIGSCSTVAGRGSGPVTGRQESPHAHAVAVTPDGTVLSTDLGADVLRAYRLDAGTLLQVAEMKLPAGSGPRHLAVHPSGHVYVLTELAQTLVMVEAGDGWTDLKVVGESAATAGGADALSQGAAIKLAADGRFVYTSMRGADLVTVHEVRGGGETVRALLDVECGGRWPRDVCVERDRLYVANERSHTVTACDLVDGMPENAPTVVAEVPSPACIVWAQAS